MLTHIKSNRLFFSSIVVLALAGAVYLFFSQKTEMTFFFSDHRHYLMDIFFKYFTKMGEELSYLVLFFVLLFRKVRYSMLVVLTGLVVMAVSYPLKEMFSIDRPVAFFEKHQMMDDINLIQGVEMYTGATSFPSGHSMSAFALFSLMVLLLPKRKRYIFPLLLIAIGVAVSRVYLVQHFFPDVYAGGLIGVTIALVLFSLDQKMKLGEDHFLEKPVWR